MGRQAIGLALALLVGLAAAVGCEGRRDSRSFSHAGMGAPDNPGSAGDKGSSPDTGSGTSTSTADEGPCVAEGLCGDEIHEVAWDVPTLYFVFDRSGSMSAQAPNSPGKTSYQVVRNAAIDVVASLGPLIDVGAALFPKPAGGDCAGGEEVFPVAQGDSKSLGDSGPTLTGFSKATQVSPGGGTPVSATFDLLQPTLAAIDGRVMVLLLTDGGPNCNANASCDDLTCQLVIDNKCNPGEACCNPENYGPKHCVDEPATVAAIEAIHDMGIEVYVIGVPGSEYYSGVLAAMAQAGGTAKSSGSKYHKVTDLSKLQEVFAKIGGDAISCSFPLKEPPEEKTLTNVYLDCELVGYDPVDGWTWKDDDETVWLHGDACAKLKAGEATEIHT